MKRETLNPRVKPDDRALIDRAARLFSKSRTNFVLDAARQAEQDALLDKTLFRADAEAYAAFLARLDPPPQANDRLRLTMPTRAPWD